MISRLLSLKTTNNKSLFGSALCQSVCQSVLGSRDTPQGLADPLHQGVTLRRALQAPALCPAWYVFFQVLKKDSDTPHSPTPLHGAEEVRRLPGWQYSPGKRPRELWEQRKGSHIEEYLRKLFAKEFFPKA